MSKQGVIFIILSAIGLFLALQFPEFFLNPGQIINGHKKIEANCFECHTTLLGPSDKKCVTCHKPLEIDRLKPNRKFHHKQLQERSCVNCHTDHRGTENKQATQAFDHALLSKKHRSQCTSCHTLPTDRLHRNIKQACHSCHTNQHWKPATFDHTRLFRFDRHHPADCASCHPDQKYDQYSCYGCHEHSPSKVRHEHLEEGIRNFQNCVTCHRSGDEDEAERVWREIRHRRDH
ncbi:MAG: class III cytochrome C family protein [Magnetococcales bacterium]|nr:class III cytochrome C family protein [Magnetococcales bacterium]